jgi:hypothetical protein
VAVEKHAGRLEDAERQCEEIARLAPGVADAACAEQAREAH